MAHDPVIIFVCEHGAAKSIVAATFFNKLAREENLRFHAIARGTNPDREVSPKTIAGLREDGLTPAESIPVGLTLADLHSVQRIITFCELPEEYHQSVDVEEWSGIPPVSEDYEKAREIIVSRLKELIGRL